MDYTKHSNIIIASKLAFVKNKINASTLNEGIVNNVLTKFLGHFHGIKIRTEDNLVDRVKEISNRSYLNKWQ